MEEKQLEKAAAGDHISHGTTPQKSSNQVEEHKKIGVLHPALL